MIQPAGSTDTSMIDVSVYLFIYGDGQFMIQPAG